MAFTQEALDFLFENRVMNSKVWFDEHRDKYERFVKQPMTELIEHMSPEVAKIDPLIVTRPSRCMSRIRRDTRFTHDKTMYRDVVWCVFMRDRKLFTYPPGFYFEFWPGGLRYGCGYYQSDTTSMGLIRQLILEGNTSFKKAKKAIEKQDIFELQGEMYKRTRHKDQPEDLRQWLDRKNLCAIHTFDSPDILFSDGFTDMLLEGFWALEPLYKFFCTACDRRLNMD